MELLYFDYCATTPVHPSVRQAMFAAMDVHYGNPSSIHRFGLKAKGLIENARKLVADGIGAQPEEIIFTSGATEAINMAIMGSVQPKNHEKRHVIVSAIEHHATLHTVDALARQGIEVTILPVDQAGLVSPDDVRSAIRPDTALISVMMVNNEVGSLQDIARIGDIARENGVLFHTDAVQAVNCYSIDVDELNVDMLSLSGHKIYGPKGIGALYIRSGVELEPIMFGGSQELQIRPGTENVPGIVGLGAAMGLRNETYANRFSQFKQLRLELLDELKSVLPNYNVNGQAERTAPHILSISFPGMNAEMLLFRLSEKGVAVSMGSACNSENVEPSHVLSAMHIPIESIESTLRISIGEPTTSADIKAFVAVLSEVIESTKLTF